MNGSIVKTFKKFIFVLLAATLTFTVSGCGLFNSQPQSAVYISQAEISLEVGATVKLTAATTDGKSVSWVSSMETVATVDGDGTVTAVAAGETLITAASDSSMASCTVKVKEKQTSATPDTEIFTLCLDALKLTVGESVTLKAVSSLGGEIEWSSSKPQVASVAAGRVTALALGSTVITASTGRVSAECTVTVIESVQPDGSEKDGYRLVWRDEFNGTALDTAKWNYQTGTQDTYGNDTGVAYWGNNEQQYYTQDAVTVENGSLKITAEKRRTGDRDYTSGRILTRDKASWTFGYFEAKMKLPVGNGMWPAFWMLPQPSSPQNTSNEYGGWPLNGEIDIMEARGRQPDRVDNTIHFGSAWPNNKYLTKVAVLSSGIDEWHVYGVEWTADYIAWFADGVETFRLTKDRWYTDGSSVASAPFDRPFYILFNLAVGGNYDGGIAPDASFTSASMLVDYVRAYEKIS